MEAENENGKQVEEAFVHMALRRSRASAEDGQFADALGLLGITLDSYAWNETFRVGMKDILSGLIEHPSFPRTDLYLSGKIEGLGFDLLSADVVAHFNSASARSSDHIQPVPLPYETDALESRFLVRALFSNRAATGERAIGLLNNFSVASGDFHSVVVRALTNPDVIVRTRAAQILGLLPAMAALALEPLTSALADPQTRVKLSAASALGNVGRNALAAVPALMVAMDDKQDAVRLAAAEAIGKIRPQSLEPISALKEALSDREIEVREKATWALGQIGTVPAAQILISVAQDDQEHVRRHAVEALRHLYSAMQAVMPRRETAPDNLKPSNEAFIEGLRTVLREGSAMAR